MAVKVTFEFATPTDAAEFLQPYLYLQPSHGSEVVAEKVAEAVAADEVILPPATAAAVAVEPKKRGRKKGASLTLAGAESLKTAEMSAAPTAATASAGGPLEVLAHKFVIRQTDGTARLGLDTSAEARDRFKEIIAVAPSRDSLEKILRVNHETLTLLDDADKDDITLSYGARDGELRAPAPVAIFAAAPVAPPAPAGIGAAPPALPAPAASMASAPVVTAGEEFADIPDFLKRAQASAAKPAADLSALFGEVGADAPPSDPDKLRDAVTELFRLYATEKGFTGGREFLDKHGLTKLSAATTDQLRTLWQELKGGK